ncbi:SRPBCC family protein [Allosphingosinicella flava]|uniref:SRPBCC family protein n=1 Tax=Allosphingosinicella flava TaxID=2771430 RepID=A0A7T2LM94_9SPHN|nr:SRPBCC family protein [Sphingosinicella flava]QPQ55314.1 SRPBCC family protein [Sphingosinicella flava]
MPLNDFTRDLTGKQKAAAAIGAGAFLIGAAAAVVAASRANEGERSDTAPGSAARKNRFGKYAVVARAITIDRPRAELYAFWRDFQNLPQFMEDVESIEPTGQDRDIWTIRGPAGKSFRVETEVSEEREGEFIAWRSVEGSEIDTQGKVTFTDAPSGRGTVVEAIIAYDPPGGNAGRAIAKLFQHEPGIQARRELRRFKMLMETGEIATAANRREDA